MKKDITRAIGYLNLVLDEAALKDEDKEYLRQALRVLINARKKTD